MLFGCWSQFIVIDGKIINLLQEFKVVFITYILKKEIFIHEFKVVGGQSLKLKCLTMYCNILIDFA